MHFVGTSVMSAAERIFHYKFPSLGSKKYLEFQKMGKLEVVRHSVSQKPIS
jgi:hypothetical protein